MVSVETVREKARLDYQRPGTTLREALSAQGVKVITRGEMATLVFPSGEVRRMEAHEAWRWVTSRS